MVMQKKVFMVAGEASGDLHGSMLVRHIKKKYRGFTFYGVGGRELEKEGMQILYNCSEFTAMGIVEPLLKIRFYKKALGDISSFIISNGINTVILIDFPGFNLRLARILRKRGIRIIYYISPQIWAWHYSRIKTIKKYVHAIIVFYPFEADIYEREGVRAYFVGNPLLDIVSEKLERGAKLNLNLNKPAIAILPGSRISEAERHVAPMLEAAKLIGERYRCTFILPVLSGGVRSLVEKSIDKYAHEADIRLILDNTYRAIEKADILITSSGTATLEAAILGKPMVIIYRVGIIFELLARIFVRVQNISLVNIVAGKRICPELLQREVTAERIFEETAKLLDDEKLRDRMKHEIELVREKLGSPGAIGRIADLVVSLIEE
jgi:lipid-A-disaccharide synthase